MKKILSLMLAFFALSMLVSCGGTPELKLSEQAKTLMNKTWYPDTKADTKLGGDVEKIGNWLSGKYLFGTAEKDPSMLVYSITQGEGFFSAVTGSGKWELSADDKTLLTYPYDYEAKQYKTEPVKHTIIELTPEKLVWQADGMPYPEHFTSTKPE